MSFKSIVIKESYYFKEGEIVEGTETKDGLVIKEHLLSKGSYIVLSESLTPQDEERIKVLAREIIKRMFWRLYTRAAFITQ